MSQRPGLQQEDEQLQLKKIASNKTQFSLQHNRPTEVDSMFNSRKQRIEEISEEESSYPEGQRLSSLVNKSETIQILQSENPSLLAGQTIFHQRSKYQNEFQAYQASNQQNVDRFRFNSAEQLLPTSTDKLSRNRQQESQIHPLLSNSEQELQLASQARQQMSEDTQENFLQKEQLNANTYVRSKFGTNSQQKGELKGQLLDNTTNRPELIAEEQQNLLEKIKLQNSIEKSLAERKKNFQKEQILIRLPDKAEPQQNYNEKKNIFKIIKEVLIYFIDFLEILITLAYWFLSLNAINTSEFNTLQLSKIQNLKILYWVNIGFTILIHIIGWIYISFYMKKQKYNIIYDIFLVGKSIVLGILSYIKITPFIIYNTRNKSIPQFSYNQVCKYLKMRTTRNPTILFKKRNRPLNIFRDLIFLRVTKFSMLITVINQTIPQLFLQYFFLLDFNQQSYFNIITLTILQLSLVFGLLEITRFVAIKQKQNHDKIPSFQIQKIIIETESEVKRLRKGNLNLLSNVAHYEIQKVNKQLFEKIRNELPLNIENSGYNYQNKELSLRTNIIFPVHDPFYFYEEISPLSISYEQIASLIQKQIRINNFFFNIENPGAIQYPFSLNSILLTLLKCIKTTSQYTILVFFFILQSIFQEQIRDGLLAGLNFLILFMQLLVLGYGNFEMQLVLGISLISNLFIKWIWFFLFNKYNWPYLISISKNFYTTSNYCISRIFLRMSYFFYHFSEEKFVDYNLGQFQNFYQNLIKYQKILSQEIFLHPKQLKRNTSGFEIPIYFQAEWRDYILLSICKILTIYANLFLAPSKYSEFMPYIIIYQILEEIRSNYYLIKLSVSELIASSLVLQMSSLEHFYQTMLVFIDRQQEIVIEFPHFFTKLAKADDNVIQQCAISIPVQNLSFSHYQNKKRSIISDSIQKSFNQIKKLELNSAESFLSMGPEISIILKAIKNSLIFDMRLKFNLYRVSPKEAQHIQTIVDFCPSHTQYLHVCVYNTFSYNLDLNLDHLGLLAFRYSFIQIIPHQNTIQQQPSINQDFFRLNKPRFFKIVYLEIDSCLSFTNYELFFSQQFIDYQKLHIKIKNKSQAVENNEKLVLNLSKLVTSNQLNTLDLQLEEFELQFGDNFQSIAAQLISFKLVLKSCIANIQTLTDFILSMTENTQIIIDISELEKGDNNQINVQHLTSLLMEKKPKANIKNYSGYQFHHRS